MNRSKGSFRIDPLNDAIVREMSVRGFRDASFDRNIRAKVDVPKAIEAFMNAIKTNLAFRRMGIVEALEARSSSRFIAKNKLDDARVLDPHLGDVMRVVAALP